MQFQNNDDELLKSKIFNVTEKFASKIFFLSLNRITKIKINKTLNHHMKYLNFYSLTFSIKITSTKRDSKSYSFEKI